MLYGISLSNNQTSSNTGLRIIMLAITTLVLVLSQDPDINAYCQATKPSYEYTTSDTLTENTIQALDNTHLEKCIKFLEQQKVKTNDL